MESKLDRGEVMLTFYSDLYLTQLQNYQFGSSKFSTHPLQAIESIKQNSNAHPIIVLYDQHVIGFLILEKLPHQSIYGDYHGAILFRSFSLDAKYRGRGLSKIVIQTLIPFVHTHLPNETTIVLTVNQANAAAIGLYKRMGFNDTGRTFLGKKGLQYVFEKRIV
jgi:RimJ/RimL family protein N-acetyltransferase